MYQHSNINGLDQNSNQKSIPIHTTSTHRAPAFVLKQLYSTPNPDQSLEISSNNIQDITMEVPSDPQCGTPKFCKNLIKSLLTQKKVISSKREYGRKNLEYFECILYQVCGEWRRVQQDAFLDISPVDFHPLMRLQTVESNLFNEDLQLLSTETKLYLEENCSIFKQYNLFMIILEFVSGLSVQYGIARIHDFMHKLTDRTLNIKLLDLQEMSKDFYTMETIWICTKIHYEPFSSIADDLTKQTADILQQSFISISNFIGQLNSGCPYEEVPSIFGLIGSNSLAPHKSPSVVPSSYTGKLEYQSLKINRGIFGFCMKRHQSHLASQLKELIHDFHQAYVQFEHTLIRCVLETLDGVDFKQKVGVDSHLITLCFFHLSLDVTGQPVHLTPRFQASVFIHAGDGGVHHEPKEQDKNSADAQPHHSISKCFICTTEIIHYKMSPRDQQNHCTLSLNIPLNLMVDIKWKLMWLKVGSTPSQSQASTISTARVQACPPLQARCWSS